MENRESYWLSLVAALSFGLIGCGDSSTSSGGEAPDTANVKVVHLAPEVPGADTGVDILVNGDTAIEDLEYGEATDRVPLAAGDYTFGIAVAGSTDAVISFPATLANGDDLTVVAYRDPDNVVAIFVFSNSTAQLAPGFGRVFVGHGADDSVLDPVNIAVVDGDTCSTLIPDFAFGTTQPANGFLDLPAATVNIGFDVADGCAPEAGPVPVPVTGDAVSILVAVDEDTNDMSLDPELWAIIPDIQVQPIRLIKGN